MNPALLDCLYFCLDYSLFVDDKGGESVRKQGQRKIYIYIFDNYGIYAGGAV